MKKCSISVMFLLFANLTMFAQDKEAILTNSDVVEMVKLGITTDVILAKIKSAETRFDTSTVGLKKLKEEGVSDSVIIGMIERGSSRLSEVEAPANAKLPVLDPKLAVGKRKVFIETDDEESKVELTQRLTKRKFTVLDSRDNAELIFEFRVEEGAAQSRTGIFRGVETTTKTRTGTLVVSLFEGKPLGIIFAREWEPRFSTGMGVYGSSGPPKIRDQIRWFFVPKYVQLLNKAGDRIP